MKIEHLSEQETAVVKLVFFLYHMYKEQPDAIYGSHRIKEVWESLATIVEVPPDELLKQLEQVDNLQ